MGMRSLGNEMSTAFEEREEREVVMPRKRLEWCTTAQD